MSWSGPPLQLTLQCLNRAAFARRGSSALLRRDTAKRNKAFFCLVEGLALLHVLVASVNCFTLAARCIC
jgi:hypothetical protein